MKEHLQGGASVLIFSFWCAVSAGAVLFIAVSLLGATRALSAAGVLLAALLFARRPQRTRSRAAR